MSRITGTSGLAAGGTAIDLRGAIERRSLSPAELADASLSAIGSLEPRLNAFAAVLADGARERTRRLTKALSRRAALPCLYGLPVSVKDLIDIKGVPTRCGSRVTPAHAAVRDAPVVERLLRAGACIVGKTTTSEFGCKPVGDSPLTGVTRHPRHPDKTPGGSSAGAASSVAAGITPFAVGTDGGGSVRIPAALCGIVGVKPQFGRIPVYPPSATPTLAHVGVLARRVKDAALLLETLAGPDSRDPDSLPMPVPRMVDACAQPIAGVRIAWSPTLGYASPQLEVVASSASAVRVLEGLGGRVTQVDRVFDDPFDIWAGEFYSGVAARMKTWMRTTPELIDPEVLRMLDEASVQSATELGEKRRARLLFRERVLRFFEQYDVLLTPTLPVASVDAGRNVPLETPDRNLFSWVYYTYPFNLTGQPAASLPCGMTEDGFPVGLQIVARPHGENDLFRVAAALERALGDGAFRFRGASRHA